MKDKQDTVLPTDSEERKGIPLATGVLDYFPAALAEVARLSKVGNDKHNPGEDLHWARGKSMDHADTIVRHLVERGTIDKDGIRHSVKVAWRALALLQEELEREEGAPMPRGARLTVAPKQQPIESCTMPERQQQQPQVNYEEIGMFYNPLSEGRSQR